MLLFAITYAHTNIFEITSVWKKIELSLKEEYGGGTWKCIQLRVTANKKTPCGLQV